MGLTAIPIDLGNGVVVYTRPTQGQACLEQGHYGLRVPEFEVPVTEYGARDGGTVGTTRANARHMRLSIAHPALWTEAEIRRLFTPGVQRIISTPLGTMPYYVEGLSFPDSLWEGQYRFGLNIVSPLAYPRGALEAVAATTDAYSTTTYDTDMSAVTVPAEDAGYRSIAQTFTVTPGDIITDLSLRVRAVGSYSGAYARSYIVPVAVDGKPDPYAAYTSVYQQSIGSEFAYVGWKGEFVVPAGVTQVALRMRCSTSVSTLEAMRNPNGDGYTGGAGCYKTSSAWFFGDGIDTTIDWQHRITKQVEAASTTEVQLTSTTELPAYPKVTVTLAANASSLTISDGVRTATITGAMTAGDVVVLDCDALTLTVNGTDRIAWFDRDGDFPVINPDTSSITMSVPGTIAVEWYPRVMGLV